MARGGAVFKRGKRGTRARRDANYTARWTDAAGRMVWRSTGTKNRQVAEAFLAARLAEVGRGEVSVAGSELFGDVAETWLARHQARRSAADNVSRYRTHLREPFGALRLRDIRPEAIEAFAQAVVASGRSPATAWRALALLRKVLNDAVRDRRLGESPFRHVRRENLPREPKARPFRWYSPEDLGRLVAAADAVSGDRVFIGALAYAGLRIGEAAGLRWEDVDLDGGFIVVRRSWSAEVTKGGEPRRVPLAPPLRGLLAEWRTRCPAGPLALPTAGGFMRHKGSPFYAWWNRLVEAAGVERLHPHAIRHSFASAFLQAGGDLFVLQRILGHSTISLTERYSHLRPAWAADQVGRLAYPAPPADNVAPLRRAGEGPAAGEGVAGGRSGGRTR